ncbi:hypothetical protein SEA_MACGULLY_28 [Rhodococcus phage MacGully]|nr:hypothetical protein SEA_MACGULLY_28 [Rhodococcus phage MacGully]
MPNVQMLTPSAHQTTNNTLSVTRNILQSPGDLILIFVYSWTNAITFAPAGFTKLGEAGTGASTMTAWWKIAGSSEPTSYAFTFAGTGNHMAFNVTLRGADPTRPIAGHSEVYYEEQPKRSPGTAVYPIPTKMPAGGVELRVCGSGVNSSTASWTWPAGVTEYLDTRTSSGYRYMTLAGNTDLPPTQSIPQLTPTFSNSTPTYNAGITVLVRPRRRGMIEDLSRGFLLGWDDLEFRLTPP